MVSYGSTMDAITQSTLDGLRLAAAVVAMLVVFLSLTALANSLLGLGPEIGGAPVTLERLLGWLMAALGLGYWRSLERGQRCRGTPWQQDHPE